MPVRLGPMPKESPQAQYLDADFEPKIDPNHQAGSLGDIIHTLPAIALLREAHPHAEITWVINAGTRSSAPRKS